MSDKSKSLPSNWEQTTIGEVCSKPQYGWTTSAAESGDIKLLRTTDITGGEVDWNTVPFCRDAPPEPEKYLLADGDIVVSRAGSVGVSHRVLKPERSVFASYLIRFRPKPVVDGKYLSYILQSPAYWSQVRGSTAGIAVPNVNASKLEAFEIPLAPLPEQRRIVEEIEKQFTRLEAGVAALRRVQANLKRYRAAVLKTACEGRLVKQDSTFNRESSNNWISTELGKVVTFTQGIQIPVPEQRLEPTNGDVPFLRIVNYTQGDSEFRYITNPGDKYIIQKDEIVMVRYGAPGFVGRGYKGVLANNLFRITPQSLLSKPYLYYLLKSKSVADLIRSRQKGGTMQAISFGQLKDIPISIPPLSEQTRIVAEVERRLSVIEELESVVTANLQRAASLRQSILQKAFTGELV